MSLLQSPLTLGQRLTALQAHDAELQAAWKAARAAGNDPVRRHLSDMLDDSERRMRAVDREIRLRMIRGTWAEHLDRDLADLAAQIGPIERFYEGPLLLWDDAPAEGVS